MFRSHVCPDRSPFRFQGKASWPLDDSERQHIPVSTSTGPLCHHEQSGVPDGRHCLRIRARRLTHVVMMDACQ